jgi:uncharacterized protein (TIGR02001 family)
MFRKTVMAGVLAAAFSPLSGWAQQPADPGAAPGSSTSTAATPAPTPALTGNMGVFSQYIFRGLTQTDRKPALQGGFDYAHASGLYVGTWASNISWLRDQTTPVYSRGGSLEWDFYGGYKGSLPAGVTYDLGTLYYWYPGTENPANGGPLSVKADTWELYGALGWKWLSAKYSHGLMNKTFGVRDSRGSWYLDLTATVPLGDFYKPLDGVTFIAHWGKQEYRGTDSRTAPASNDQLYSYEDWKIGLSYALPQNFTIGAFYTDTNGANRVAYGSTAEGGSFPRNIAKSAGTVFIQKTF